MKCKMTVLKILGIILLLMSIIFMSTDKYEKFTDGKCPTTMVKEGQQIIISDPNKAKIPGVNPIILNNLEEYKEYVKWQKNFNLDCPILFLENVYDVQGKNMYQIRQNFDTDTNYGSFTKSNAKKPKPYDKYNQTIGLRS